MWSIVNFTKDNSVSAVPSHWWKNGYCAWPKSSVKHPLLLLQRRAIPNKFDYDFFRARIIHTKNPIKSYVDAKERATKAQFTSELSSAEESQSNKRSNKYTNRSISPPVFSDSDNENKNKSHEKNHYNSQPGLIKSKNNKPIKFNSQVLSADTDDDNNKNISLKENHSNIQPESIESKKNKPIKFNSQMLSAGYENHENMNNSSQSKSMQLQIKSGHQVLSDNSDEIMDNEDDSDIDKTYEPPNHDRNEMNNHFEIIQSPVGSWKVHSISDEVITDNQNLNDNHQYTKETFTHKTPEMNKVKKRLFMSDSCIETKKLKSQPKVSSFDNLFQSSTKSDVLEMEYSNLNNDTEFVSFVKSSLTNLKYDLKLLSYSIDSLKTIIQSIDVNTSHISSINSEHNNFMDIQELIWPISNPTQLDVNEQLLTDTNIKKNEVRLLARLVGKSISESVRRMMSKMFEDSFLQQYSFLGFKGKSKFYGLNCCQLLFDALRNDKKFVSTPDHEISTVVAKWLAQATNRVTKKKKQYTN